MKRAKPSRGKAALRKTKPSATPSKTAPIQPPDPPAAHTVKVTAAKGRPMLVWAGKRPLTQVTAFPAQHIEAFDPSGSFKTRRWPEWPALYPEGGLLFHGDNKEVLAHLLANGFRNRVNLIYIDPPFDSGADYVRKVTLRGPKASVKVSGERHTLGEQVQYTDIWGNDSYLQFMYERLLLLKELLAQNGFLVLHLNIERSHYLKCVLDEVFGTGGFKNQIIWKRREAHSDTHGIGNVHDVLLIYSKNPEEDLGTTHVQYAPGYLDSHYTQTDASGRRYQLADMTAPGPRPGLTYAVRGVMPPPGRVWAVLPAKMEALIAEGRVVFTNEGKPRRKQFLDEMPGMPVHDVWTDVFPINSQALQATSYPTQKPEALLERIVEIASNRSSLVLDCFVGSGTTAAVAQKLSRRWIGCDINKGAIQTTSKRLQTIIQEQVAAGREATQQLLPSADGANDTPPMPAQLGFSVWRVNDYDLQIQHNEAVNLACEHIGVQRTRSDAFFDGTLGKGLVKIVPFDHPLSPLDLEELRRELESRPDEDRAVTLVCLGIELAAQAWIEDWNRLRKGKSSVNRITVIELRTDARYGQFIRHEPAEARVKVARKNGTLKIEIEDFVSPTIVQRLHDQAGVLKPTIDDWRSMVDCVMIDLDYDGSVFNVAVSDIPETKTDLVSGSYELPAPAAGSTVAVKIIDMLGEEVVVVISPPAR